MNREAFNDPRIYEEWAQMTPEQRDYYGRVAEYQMGPEWMAQFNANFEQYQQQRPEQPSAMEGIAGQLGGIAGLAGGMYAGNSLMGVVTGSGAGSAATGATTAAATGAGTTGAAAGTTAATTGTTTTTGAAGLGMAGAGAVAGGILGAYLAARGIKDTLKGKETKTPTDAAARGQAAITSFGFSELARPILKRGKDDRQQLRDGIRGRMQKMGIMSPDYKVGGVDLGKDGGFRFEDGSKVYEAYAGQEAGAAPDEQSGQLIGALNPLGYLIGGGDQDASGYATGMLVNATKKGGVDIKSLYDQAGGYDKVFSAIGDAANAGHLDINTAHAYQNALNQVYGRTESTPTPQPQQQQSQQQSQQGQLEASSFGQGVLSSMSNFNGVLKQAQPQQSAWQQAVAANPWNVDTSRMSPEQKQYVAQARQGVPR